MKITINVVKIHKISTFLAIAGAILGSVLFFLSQVDMQLNLNLLSSTMEDAAALIAILSGTIAVPSLVVSVVLSFYRMAENN
jgi:hypothetical protein